MAEKQVLALPAPPEAEGKGKSVRWIGSLLVLTVLAIVTGGGFGLMIASSVEKTVQARLKAELEKPASTSAYSGDITMKILPPVVTNLASSDNTWVRLEAAIILKDQEESADALASEIRQDILAYLRTVSLAQIQGPSGLLHLREDLNERAQVRSQGSVKELIIQTLVVQ
jgi:flagellar FliL protein